VSRAVAVRLRRNYTVGERAVVVIGAAAGKTVDEINEVLAADAKRSGGNYRPINPTSLGMASRYPSIPATEAQALWEHITHPKPLGDA